jgi:hypothetical protein
MNIAHVLYRWLPTRQCRVSLVVLAAALMGLLALAGVVPDHFALLGALPALGLIGDTTSTVTAVQGTDTQTGGASSKVKLPWRRIREKTPVTFQNVAAGSVAYAEIPRYALTLLNLTMTLSGTTFNKTHIQTIRVRLGSHVLWQFQGLANTGGTNLNTVQQYLLGFLNSVLLAVVNPTRAQMLELDFTDPRNRHLAGEMIGGIDMTRLPQGKVRIEITIAPTAVAPAIDANITWGIPQNNALIKKYLEFPYLAGVANRNSIPLNVGGAMISRLFFLYSGVDWSEPAVAPVAVAPGNNVGNGTFGTITVNPGAQIGQYRVLMLAATLGVLQGPDGRFILPHIATGVAFNPVAEVNPALSFTLTAGGTAFTAGDAFSITVSDVSDGNVNRVEVKKNGRVVWDMTCHEARYVEQKYGQAPQSKMYVADFTADQNSEGILRTEDAASMEYNAYITNASDSLVIYAEVIDNPNNN